MRTHIISIRLFLLALALGLAATSAPAQDAGFWQALQSGSTGEIYTIVPHGNDVYVGGQFLNLGGIPEADNIAKWNGTGWEALGPGLNSRCRAIAFWNGELYAGGTFVNAGGELWADRIARWDGAAWHALAVTGIDNGEVYTLAATPSYLYIGGGFNGGLQSNGAPANVLRWDGVQGAGLFPAPNSVVWALATSGEDLYVGGIFLDLGGNTAIDCFAKWAGGAWVAMGSTLSNEVRAVTVTPGGELYIGGAFQNAGGDPNADRIARWNGTNWTALGTGGPVNTVRAIAAAGTSLYVGGSFFSSSTALDAIGKWDGSSWITVGGGLSDTVFAVAAVGNDIYVGGQFTDAGGLAAADYIVRWHRAVSAAPLPTAPALVLHPGRPNPFNPATTIAFELGAAGPVRVTIHDARGRLVRELVDDVRGAGAHAVTWDGRDERGRALPSGVYLCRLQGGGTETTSKLVLAK